MLNLKPIKDRLDAATPGRWYREVTGVAHGGIRTEKTWLFADDGATEADADMVANSPTDLAALISEVEKLRRAIRAHKAWLEDQKITVDYADRNLWSSLDA